MSDLTIQIIKQSIVTEGEREQMFSLFRQYFCNLEKSVFLKDMEEKDWVIVLREESRRISGFSTIRVIPAVVEGKEVIYIFSGDTIVDKRYWQSNMLAPAFGFFMLRMIEEYRPVPLVWYLITMGYRTYRFLPVYFRRFYPVFNCSTPPEYKLLLDYMGMKKYGDNYNPESGIISFGGRRDRLREELCIIDPSKKQNPHIAFFLERNPGYDRGDELACIADISLENLNELAYRIMEGKSVSWVE